MNSSGTPAPRRPKRSRPKRRASAQLAPRREIGPGRHAKESPLRRALHRKSPRQPLCTQRSAHSDRSSEMFPTDLLLYTTQGRSVSPPLHQDTLNWPGRSPGFKGKSHLCTLMSISVCHLFICFNYVQSCVLSLRLLPATCCGVRRCSITHTHTHTHTDVLILSHVLQSCVFNWSESRVELRWRINVKNDLVDIISR